MEGFEEKEGAAGGAGEFSHEGSRTLVGKDTSDEESLGGGEVPDEASVCCDLMVYQSLCLRDGGPELFSRNQHHLAEVGRGRARPKGPIAAHALHAGT